MQLVMYLGNDCVASVSVNEKQLSVPGYMGRLKRQLLEENGELLQSISHEPEFLVTDFAAKAVPTERRMPPR